MHNVIECPGCVQRWEHDGTEDSITRALADAGAHAHKHHSFRLDTTSAEDAAAVVSDYNRQVGNL